MPKYLGPFDSVEIDSKSYRRGDNVNVSKERIAQLRANDNLLFETDDPEVAVPPNVADQRLADASSATPDEPSSSTKKTNA